MSLTSGFFSSEGGDRKYTAEQFTRLFDGIILDGVFATVGDAFRVTVNDDSEIIVGTGRAWFNHTWTYNDSELVLTPAESELLLNRIDAVVLEVNTDARRNSIRIVTGIPASNPQKPGLEYDNDTQSYQYPLAYIYRNAGTETILQEHIINAVGTDCPIVTGPLQVMNIASYITQLESLFNSWFNSIKGQIGDDLGTSLQSQINSVRGSIETIQEYLDSYSSNIESVYSDISDLGVDLDGLRTDKADRNHGTHVTYSAAAPKANYSTGRAGSESTVARSDHQHPIDTTRAEAHGYGTTDLVAGSSSLATGKLYLVYE